MATIKPDDITDLVNSTLEELGRGKITDIANPYQKHVAMRQLMDKNRVAVDSGTSIKFSVMTDYDSNTRTTGLFGVDDINQENGSTTGDVPWKYVTTGVTFDINQPELNGGTAKIWDFVKMKENQMYGNFAKKMEEYFWRGPLSSSDGDTPFGLLYYWLDYDASQGFNGGNHTNFSSGPAGIDCDTYSNWSHYTFNYSTVDDSDAIDKISDALYYCDFEAPMPQMEQLKDHSTGHRYGYYSTRDVVKEMERQLKGQNDNLGDDLVPKFGKTKLAGMDMVAVPYLQEEHATSDPIIGIDWGVFHVTVHKNKWGLKSPYQQAPLQHTVRQRTMDNVFNFTCNDRRRLWMGAKSDPMSD